MNLFIDIETIPGNSMPDLSDIKAPANYKDPEKIAAYQKEHQDEAHRKQALDSMEGQIICVGCAIDDELITVFSGDEAGVMAYLAGRITTAFNEPYAWCGWNIETFDIPWLWRKAVQYDYRELRNVIPKGNKRMIVDLMRIWAADYRDYVSMADCAEFLKIPHSEISGGGVFDLYKAGDIASIEKHCREDVQTAREIYGRIMS